MMIAPVESAWASSLREYFISMVPAPIWMPMRPRLPSPLCGSTAPASPAMICATVAFGACLAECCMYTCDISCASTPASSASLSAAWMVPDVDEDRPAGQGKRVDVRRRDHVELVGPGFVRRNHRLQLPAQLLDVLRLRAGIRQHRHLLIDFAHGLQAQLLLLLPCSSPWCRGQAVAERTSSAPSARTVAPAAMSIPAPAFAWKTYVIAYNSLKFWIRRSEQGTVCQDHWSNLDAAEEL